MRRFWFASWGALWLWGGLGLGSAAAQMAGAASQIVQFDGRILNQTCEIKESSKQLMVNLPHVRRGMLNEVGKTAGEMPFQIELMNCTSGDDKPYVMFEPNGEVDMSTGNLKNTAQDGAQNVQIQLLFMTPEMPIKLNDTMSSKPSMAQTAMSDGMVTLQYKARYYAMGQVTAGSVQASVKYTIAYQ